MGSQYVLSNTFGHRCIELLPLLLLCLVKLRQLSEVVNISLQCLLLSLSLEFTVDSLYDGLFFDLEFSIFASMLLPSTVFVIGMRQTVVVARCYEL